MKYLLQTSVNKGSLALDIHVHVDNTCDIAKISNVLYL